MPEEFTGPQPRLNADHDDVKEAGVAGFVG
jgi:hypothetical protein